MSLGVPFAPHTAVVSTTTGPQRINSGAAVSDKTEQQSVTTLSPLQ